MVVTLLAAAELLGVHGIQSAGVWEQQVVARWLAWAATYLSMTSAHVGRTSPLWLLSKHFCPSTVPRQTPA